MNSPYEVHVFDGKSWTKLGQEFGAYAEAVTAARRESRGTERAADIQQDGVKLAHFRNGRER